MAELRNSTRVMYKATHVGVMPDVEGQDRRAYAVVKGGARKAGFVRALRMDASELPALRAEIKKLKLRGARGAALNRALRATESLVKDATPMAIFTHGGKFADVSNDSIRHIGTALLAARKERARVAGEAVEKIGQDYARHLDELRKRELTAAAKRSADAKHAMRRSVNDRIGLARTVAEDESGAAVMLASPRAGTPLPRPERVAAAAAPASGLSGAGGHRGISAAAMRWARAASHPEARVLDRIIAPLLRRNPLKPRDDTEQLRAALLTIDDISWLGGFLGGFESTLPVEPIGRLHLERIEMTPVGIERGELVHSVPLTPKETVNLSHREWSQTSEGFENIVQDEFEGYSEKGVAEKNDVSQATESESKHASALNVGVSLSASYASVTLSSDFGYSSNSESHTAKKDSRNHSSMVTSRASARTRRDHKFSFKVASTVEAEDLAVRVLKNESTESVRADYFQVMRKWKVKLVRYGLRMTYDIVIPSPGAALMRKLSDLRALDAEIDRPFQFGLTLDQLTPDNYDVEAAKYNAVCDPPKTSDQLTLNWPLEKNDTDTFTFGSIDFDVTEGFEIADGTNLIANLTYHENDDKAYFNIINDPGPGPSKGPNPSDYYSVLSHLRGKFGKMAIPYQYRHLPSAQITLHVEMTPRAEAMTAWRLGAWNSIREAAQQHYVQNRQTLKERRTKLVEEINAFDGLTLRQMEREEIMRGVLGWLFGPDFEMVPWTVSMLFTEADGGLPAVLPGELDAGSWKHMLQFGEFIKYIHNAIEWENVLYFTYPYFWDTPENWEVKRFLTHPNALHRMFLRSGAARVVLTVRPGFEESFTTLMEEGSFKPLPPDHPYISIAKEIQNFAMTNYPGIPPANPETNARPLLTYRQRAAWRDMQYLIQLLEAYRKDHDSYPSALVPALQPYLQPLNDANKEINKVDPVTYAAVPVNDPWANPYVYQYPGASADFDLFSYGADGAADTKPGQTDENADISANAEGSVIATWYEYTPTSALDVVMSEALEEPA